MEWGEAILALGAGERPGEFRPISAAIDPQWIADALAATDTASGAPPQAARRARGVLSSAEPAPRPAASRRSCHHLDLVVRTPSRRPPARHNAAHCPGARSARRRPTRRPVHADGAGVGAPRAAADRGRGLAVYGLDGTTLRVADTPENVAHFGRPSSRHGEGAATPNCASWTLLALAPICSLPRPSGPTHSELALATPVWATLPEHALVILDRGEEDGDAGFGPSVHDAGRFLSVDRGPPIHHGPSEYRQRGHL